MIILVPVIRFLIQYEVVQGLPFSQLDQLVLKDVEQGAASITSLERTFRIHPRLLIQSLVSLVHAGWVALGQTIEQNFVITEEGKLALEKKALPPFVEISKRQTYVLLEQVSGIIIPENEAQYVSKKTLLDRGLWDQCGRIKAEVYENRLDEGEVYHLLPRQQGQRLHWIDRICAVSRGDHYIPVEVDIEKETVTNMPDRCKAVLQSYIIDKAKEYIAQQKKVDNQDYITWNELNASVKIGRYRPNTKPTGQPVSVWKINYSPNDLVTNGKEHVRILLQALNKAKSSVLLITGLIEPSSLESMKGELIEALKRGVDIDVLWEQGDKFSVNWLKKISYDTKDLAGKIRYNNEPSRTNGKLLIWDEEENKFFAVVGNYNWLSQKNDDALQQDRNLYLSFCISHPAIISNLSWCAAGFWSETKSEILSSVPNKWRRISAIIEAQVITEGNSSEVDYENAITIQVVTHREHEKVFQEQINNCQGRFLIASTAMDRQEDADAVSRHFIGRDVDFQAFLPLKSFSNTEIEENGESNSFNPHIKRMSSLRSNVVISDTSIFLSSYSFLSLRTPKDPFPRELGLLIEGGQLVEKIINHISPIHDE